MDQDEAFEFFIEVKNKEIQELKEKLERNNASSNAMINAGMSNRRKLTKAGDAIIKYLEEYHTCDNTMIMPTELIELVEKWEIANGRNQP